MIAPTHARSAAATELGPAFSAVRARLGLVALLLVLAGLAWWITVDRMHGMDEGPGTALGTLGWFLGIWVVMMAAMMFPSVSPTVALYSRMTRGRSPAAALVFTGGYMLTWSAAGLVAFGISGLGSRLFGDALAWNSGGHWVTGGVLFAAALYELTPLKDVCLGKCRSPLGFLLGSWRDGLSGGLRMGTRHGAWCVGCCWALMAALFALGVMSVGWMALIAAMIAAEKLLPWRRLASGGIAVLLAVLGLGVAFTAESVPGLTLPGSPQAMRMDGGSMNEKPMGGGSEAMPAPMK